MAERHRPFISIWSPTKWANSQIRLFINHKRAHTHKHTLIHSSFTRSHFYCYCLLCLQERLWQWLRICVCPTMPSILMWVWKMILFTLQKERNKRIWFSLPQFSLSLKYIRMYRIHGYKFFIHQKHFIR